MDSKSGDDATDEHKGRILANILMMKKNQSKLKQIWVAEIEFNVLYHSIYKDSHKAIRSPQTRD